jgi:hypothetical protein
MIARRAAAAAAPAGRGGEGGAAAAAPPARPRPRIAAAATGASSSSSPQQRPKPQHPYAFSFSAGGLLFPYHWGVATELSRQGALDRATTPLAGASAGSIIVACLRSGLPVERVTDACLSLAADCRSGGTRARLGPVLEAMLQELLPEDVHERCSAGGSAHIAVTRLFPSQQQQQQQQQQPSSSAPSSAASLPPLSPLASVDGSGSSTGSPARAAAAAVAARVVRPELLSSYHERDDLISAVLTSSHIPWYLDGKLSRTFRGRPHLDGGLTQFIPVIPNTVVVGGGGGSSSSGGSGSSGEESGGEESGSQERLSRLVRVTCFPSRAVDAAVQRAAAMRAGRGRSSAEAAAAAEVMAAAAAAERQQGGALLPRFAEVSPDRFSDWGVSMREAVAMAFEPAPDATLLALLEKGREDARAWLAEEGTRAAATVPAAAAAANGGERR